MGVATMKFSGVFAVSLAAALGWASASFAGFTVPVPAPLLGAGLPGLAILAVAGGGYVAMRVRRRNRD
jgi:hypothetical protein